MKNIEIRKELLIHIIFIIILFSFTLLSINPNLFLFWQPIIDNLIIFVFLYFIYLNSSKWSWFSKRILYSIIFILFLNTYATLFGIDLSHYIRLYIIPILSVAITIFVTTTAKIINKLYKLWRDGKIKFLGKNS